MRPVGLILALTLAVLCSASAPARAKQAPGKIRLVLMIGIDQMQMDYLNRFSQDFRSGLRRLYDRGAVFTNAHQNHALTETAPGHSTLLSGSNPSRSGIIANQWYGRAERKIVYCVEDSASSILGHNDYPGRSPRNFKATTLGDWLKSVSPESKVYSVAGKDRSAILMGGKKADGAYWYDIQTGNFITSAYYVEKVPSWVATFNGHKYADQQFGKTWDRLVPDVSFYNRFGQDRIVSEGDEMQSVFPHIFNSLSLRPASGFYTYFASTPFLDEHIERFARRLTEEYELGQDGATDLLAIGFSALDFIGHSHGPYSHEATDTIMRLDLVLGGLFRFLDGRIGLDQVAVVLSADHGVLPLAENLEGAGKLSRRIERSDILRFQNLNSRMSEKLGKGKWILEFASANFYLNYEEIGRHNLKRSEVEQTLASILKEFDLVDTVYTRTEIQRSSEDPFLQLYRNSFHEENSGDVLARFKERHLATVSRVGTSHGSPYHYDTNVPILFMGKDIRPRVSSQRIHTVDIAPTLADWLRIEKPKDLDGQSRLGMLRE